MTQHVTPRSAAQKATPLTGPPARARTVNPWVVLTIILTAVFMQLLDTTITMVGVPSIQNSLHSSFGEIQLVVAGYMLAFACVLVTGGALGDTYGRKHMFLWGMAGFTIASAVCGAAPDALTLIVSRVVQGMSSGLMFPQVLGIIQVVFSKAQRTRAIGFYGATIGLATILGPVTGGGLIDLNIADWGWRSIFYMNVPIGVAAIVLAARMIPESKAGARRRIDLPGAGLLGAGLFLLVLPLVIGRDQGWPPWSFGCLAVSPIVLAAFIVYERNRTSRDANPLIDTTLFRHRPFTVGLIACLVFFTGIPSFFMILLLTLQEGLGYSPVKAGAVTLGFAVALAIGSARSAAVTKRLGTRVLLAGCALMIAGQLAVIGVMAWAGTGLAGWQLLAPMFVAGLAAGSSSRRSPTSCWRASAPAPRVPPPVRWRPRSRSARRSASPSLASSSSRCSGPTRTPRRRPCCRSCGTHSPSRACPPPSSRRSSASSGPASRPGRMPRTRPRPRRSVPRPPGRSPRARRRLTSRPQSRRRSNSARCRPPSWTTSPGRCGPRCGGRSRYSRWH